MSSDPTRDDPAHLHLHRIYLQALDHGWEVAGKCELGGSSGGRSGEVHVDK